MIRPEMIEREQAALMRNYGRYPVEFVRGEGAWLFDPEGRGYLDLMSGISMINAGHCHPDVVAAIREQAGTLINTSNLYYTEPMVELAEWIRDTSMGGRVFFCNSGAEASEAAIKLARKHGGPDRTEFVSLEDGFHGRTMGALALTGQPGKQEAFRPLMPGARYVPRNDKDALRAAVSDKTCAIAIEIVQGECGVYPLDDDFVRLARELADEHGALLIVDEIQTGMSRTGPLYAYQDTGIEPDVMCLAKSLGGGFPIGAVTAKPGIGSLNPRGDGLEIAPAFNFDKNPDVKLVGKVQEKGANRFEGIMDGVDGAVVYFIKDVDYTQKVIVKTNLSIKGKHSYQVCDESKCLPNKTKSFVFEITGFATTTTLKEPVLKETHTEFNDTSKKTAADLAPKEKNEQEHGLLWLFLMSVLGGLAAVITPCVYSMIPITVSFFTKRSKTRAEGIRNAIYYSLSIMLIFTILGVMISVMFGANALNNLSTNWIANIVFFAIFIVFGISFLGAFEITLPSSWTNKTDSKAGVGSFMGIFFMALTLVIVSFSCTGPIVGPLLVIAGQGGIAGPALGMFGFSLGLALPFALFAVFPGMLNKMATSGGWLNQVKVVLGFLELMLAMKFLSNADLAQGWRLLDREIFIAIWIVLSILIGFYLLGRLKLSHDDASPKNIYGQEYVSIFKLFLAIIAFSFAVYLVPGMWGAPLNGMSQFIPPMGTQDYVVSNGGGSNINSSDGGNAATVPHKFVEEMKIYEPPIAVQNGLVTFYDYEEALNAAKILKKPLMLDFTGINCVNCRKMESQVWSNPEVMKRLKEDFIIVSLYCDYDKIELPKEQQFFSKELNSQVLTLGDWNEALQASKFNANSQPFYFYIDENGNKLADKGYSYDPDAQKFISHLDAVKERYKSKK